MSERFKGAIVYRRKNRMEFVHTGPGNLSTFLRRNSAALKREILATISGTSESQLGFNNDVRIFRNAMNEVNSSQIDRNN